MKRFLSAHKRDLALILVILGVALGTLLLQTLTREEGAYAVVYRDGEEIARYALGEDITVRLETESGYNLLVIKDGAVSIEEASCPDLLCVKRGKKRYEGQTLVCLPNGLVVAVEGGQEGDTDLWV